MYIQGSNRHRAQHFRDSRAALCSGYRGTGFGLEWWVPIRSQKRAGPKLSQNSRSRPSWASSRYSTSILTAALWGPTCLRCKVPCGNLAAHIELFSPRVYENIPGSVRSYWFINCLTLGLERPLDTHRSWLLDTNLSRQPQREIL